MKYLPLFVGLILILSTVGCERQTDQPQPIVLSCELSGAESATYYLIRSDEAVDFKHYNEVLDSARTDTSGVLTFQFEADSGDFYQVRTSEGFNAFWGKNLFLSPGDSLMLAFENGFPQFHGSAAKANQIQWDLRLKYYDSNEARPVYQGRRSLEPNDFEALVNGFKNDQDSLIFQTAMDLELPSVYSSYLLEQAQFQLAADIWDYLEYHRYYAHDVWEYMSPDSLSTDIVEAFSPETNYPYLESYRNALSGYIDYLHQEASADMVDSLRWLQEFESKFDQITQNLSGDNQELGLLDLSKDFWMYVNVLQADFYPRAAAIHDYFDAHKSSNKYFSVFDSNYQDFLAIAPGNPAPDFTLPDTTGQMISLSDFRGKVIYIDFWGAWCGPCLASIPHHLELQQQLAGLEEVVFLYIALEYSEAEIENWKKFIAARDFPGVHLVAEKQFHNEALKPYKLNAAPSYVLIDQEGNIASPRASGPEHVFEDITELLGVAE